MLTLTNKTVVLQGLITGSFALSVMAMQSAIYMYVYACVFLHVYVHVYTSLQKGLLRLVAGKFALNVRMYT